MLQMLEKSNCLHMLQLTITDASIMHSEYCMNHFIFLIPGMPSFCLAALSSLSSFLQKNYSSHHSVWLHSPKNLQQPSICLAAFSKKSSWPYFIGLHLSLLPAAPMPIFFRFMPSKSFTPSLHVAAYCCSSSILSMV